MKGTINLWLVAALLCGLSLSVTSCKDDDDNGGKSDQQQQEQEAKASKFWSVVGQLVSSDSYDADYEGKTFEPTIGIPESNGSLTRIVETNDMQTAARRFADLVSVDGGSPAVHENTPSYTWSDPEVGTLTYTRGGTAAEWATVDVNIKQVPHLRKIVYREGGEGTNASFAGKAWYRFGDVVKRTLDNGKVEYWICVRPAFCHEKKGDSHWVCLNYLPPKNFFNYSYDSKSWTVPTGIGTDKENMQNLAEMLYAIIHPQQWYTNAYNLHTDGKLWGFSGLPIFADFKKANVMYHNQYFWQKVADAWEKHKIADNAMNILFGALVDVIEHDGIHLLYNGYSWWTKTSWNCTLYEASYTNGTKSEEKNLHHAEYKEVKKRMEDIKFDCTKMGGDKGNYIQFFDNDGKYRWVVRHATGKELNGGSQPAPTSKLQGPGIQDVYRYYDEYPEEWQKPDPNDGNGPEITVAYKNDPATWNTSEYTGPAHYHYFNIYKDQKGNRWFPVKCAGGKYSDKAPFTYFVSFEGLEASADGRRITNLPTRDMAIKIMPWLWCCMSNFSISNDGWLDDEDPGMFSPVYDYQTMVLTAGIHPHHLWKSIVPEGIRIEAKVLVASVGYTDDDNSTGQQKLIRWIDFPDDYEGPTGSLQRFPCHYFWTSYPKFQTVDKFFPTEFTGETMYLQDAASADMIAKRAEEPYVYCPLVQNLYSKVADAAVLSPRKEPIEAAKLATNYIYNMAEWAKYQIPLDIWREPVLLFRVTRLYDRGNNEYATLSENGIKLTPIKENPEVDEDGINGMEEVYRSKIDDSITNILDFKHTIDGKDQKPTTYREDVIQ